jgi:hypothetical protein
LQVSLFRSVVFAVVLGFMAHKGSPVIDVIGAIEADDPTGEMRPEEHFGSPSSDRSSDSGHESITASQEEEGVVVDPDKASWSYIFGPSIVTVSHIREMAFLCYFAEGDARALGEEIILEHSDDEVVVFDEFFAVGLRMPPRPVLADILFMFQVQLHQLTPNTIVHLSKYFWVVLSFGGVPTSDGFAKCYELQY